MKNEDGFVFVEALISMIILAVATSVIASFLVRKESIIHLKKAKQLEQMQLVEKRYQSIEPWEEKIEEEVEPEEN